MSAEEAAPQGTLAWCHTCALDVRSQTQADGELQCPQCEGNFIEAVDDENEFNSFMEHPPPLPQYQQQSPTSGTRAENSGALPSPDPLFALLLHGLGGGGGLFGPPAGGGGSGGSVGDFGVGDITRLIDELMASDPGSHGAPPASAAAIKALDDVTISGEATSDDDDRECPVCQEQFETGSVCKRLPCNHVFHPDCIMPWLTAVSICRLEQMLHPQI